MGFMDDVLKDLRDLNVPETSWADVERRRPGYRAKYETLLERMEVVNAEPADELPSNFVGEARQWVTSTRQAMGPLANGQAYEAGPIDGFAERVDTGWRWWTDRGRLALRAVDAQALADSAHTAAALERARAASEEAAAILEDLKRLAEAAGTLSLSTHYTDQADARRKTAKTALLVGVVLVAALVGAGFGLLHSIPAGEEWTTLARDVLARGFAIAALSYGVAFAARVYRSNTHLAAVYEQKAIALRTFNLFAATVVGEDERMLILGELVRAVFAQANTGVLEQDAEHTVIDAAAPIATSLMAARGVK